MAPLNVWLVAQSLHWCDALNKCERLNLQIQDFERMKTITLNQVSDFELRLLRIFRTVVQSGSFTGAETALGISRSAISVHMSDLENRLGLRLCQRGRSGFSLTDEGRYVLQAGEAVLTAIESFRTEVNQLHRQLRGELNVGIVNNLVTQPRMRITDALKCFQALDDVKVNLSMSTPGDIERGLLDGRLHVGAIPHISQLSGLEYHALYDEHCHLYCSSEHPLFNAQGDELSAALPTHPTVLPTFPVPTQAMELLQQLNGKATASDREGIAFLILTGGYLGFLPDHYAAGWVSKGQMRALDQAKLAYETPISIVVPKSRRPSLILSRFLEAIGVTK